MNIFDIKPELKAFQDRLITLEEVEDAIATASRAIIPIRGDCLEGAGVLDGGWVAVDFTRFPAPPRSRSKGGDGSEDLCLCYVVFPGAKSPRYHGQGVHGRLGFVADGGHLLQEYVGRGQVPHELRYEGRKDIRCDFCILGPGQLPRRAGNGPHHPRGKHRRPYPTQRGGGKRAWMK